MNKSKGFGWIVLGFMGIGVAIYFGFYMNALLSEHPKLFGHWWEPILMRMIPWVYGLSQFICFYKAGLQFGFQFNWLAGNPSDEVGSRAPVAARK